MQEPSRGVINDSRNVLCTQVPREEGPRTRRDPPAAELVTKPPRN